MAPKNKKAQKMSMGDFLADTSTGISWADEMDELPTAPAPRDPNEPPHSGLGGSHLSRQDPNRYGDRDRDSSRWGADRDRDGFDRPSRQEIPVPDKAPFNAFVGNLSWETGSTELEQFFGPDHIISIRMINDNMTGKPKGYGYVEFDERDALVAALEKSGRDVGGRAIRVSVAEPPKERDDRTGGAWRREGPLPGFDEGPRRARQSSNYERSSMDEVDRGERMGFGSKFVPSATNTTNLTRRTQSGRGFSRNEGPGPLGDEPMVERGERMGFGSKFVASLEEPKKDREPPRRGSNFVPSRATPVGSDDGHSASGGSVRRAPFAERKPAEVGLTAADSVSDWRSSRPASSSERDSPASVSPAAPPVRRKLELAARTVTSSDGTLTPPQSVMSTKPSPFGAAKPVDTIEREKAIQEKLDREREELAAAVTTKKTGAVGGEKKQASIEGEQKEAPLSAVPSETSVAAKAPKPNPFGAAKPVDTLQKEMLIEEKLERERKLLEEKVKKEAEEGKASAKPVAVGKVDDGGVVAVASGGAPQPAGKINNPNSRWRSQASQAAKQLSNGAAAPAGQPPPPSTAEASGPSPTPKSPSLSSFRKEGVSFAALARTAAASPQAGNGPVGAANASPPKSGSGGDEGYSQRTISSGSNNKNQQPKTILKRVETVIGGGGESQKE